MAGPIGKESVRCAAVAAGDRHNPREVMDQRGQRWDRNDLQPRHQRRLTRVLDGHENTVERFLTRERRHRQHPAHMTH